MHHQFGIIFKWIKWIDSVLIKPICYSCYVVLSCCPFVFLYATAWLDWLEGFRSLISVEEFVKLRWEMCYLQGFFYEDDKLTNRAKNCVLIIKYTMYYVCICILFIKINVIYSVISILWPFKNILRSYTLLKTNVPVGSLNGVFIPFKMLMHNVKCTVLIGMIHMVNVVLKGKFCQLRRLTDDMLFY